jgi:hypothetical protein
MSERQCDGCGQESRTIETDHGTCCLSCAVRGLYSLVCHSGSGPCPECQSDRMLLDLAWVSSLRGKDNVALYAMAAACLSELVRRTVVDGEEKVACGACVGDMHGERVGALESEGKAFPVFLVRGGGGDGATNVLATVLDAVFDAKMAVLGKVSPGASGTRVKVDGQEQG